MARTLVALLLVIASAMLIYAAVSHRWWRGSVGHERRELGLLSHEYCNGPRCSTHDYTEIAQLEDGEARTEATSFLWAGRIAFAADLATAALAGLLAVLLLAGARVHRIVQLLEAGFMVSLFAGLGVAGYAPEIADPLPYGAAFYLQWVGLGLALVGGFAADELA